MSPNSGDLAAGGRRGMPPATSYKVCDVNRRAVQQAGNSLIEFALILPLLLVLIANVVNFAGLFYAFITVGNASRSAGDYTIMGHLAYSGTDPSGAAGPEFTAPSENGSSGAMLVANMLATDMSSLPNQTTLTVRVCLLSPSNAAISNATCNVYGNSSGSMTQSSCSGPGAPALCTAASPSPDTSTGEGGSYILTWVDVSYTYAAFIPLNFSFPGLGFGLTLPSNLTIHRQSVYRVLQ